LREKQEALAQFVTSKSTKLPFKGLCLLPFASQTYLR